MSKTPLQIVCNHLKTIKDINQTIVDANASISKDIWYMHRKFPNSRRISNLLELQKALEKYCEELM